MPEAWFRVPTWCMAMHAEPAAARARAWVYLLGAWHAGDDPSVREVRRVTGFGGGRAEQLVRDVATWAIEAGARVPDRVAGQQRGGSGAEAGRLEAQATPTIGAQRGSSGAEAGQQRGSSRARDLLSEREREERGGEGPALRAPTPAPRPTPSPEPPEDDLVAYLGLGLQGHAIALIRAGCTTRAQLLALSPEQIRYTSGLGGARAAAVIRRVEEAGDRLAPDPEPKPKGRRNGHHMTSAYLAEAEAWAAEDPTVTPETP